MFLYKRNEEQSDGSELSVLIDQKTYLEEVNRNLRWVIEVVINLFIPFILFTSSSSSSVYSHLFFFTVGS